MKNIAVLHLEPTTNCNAACPQCRRTIKEFVSAELSIDDVTRIFSVEFIKSLDKIFMCGNLGDPAAAKDTIEIFKFFRKHNPDIVLGMNTNGGIRTTKWWKELAHVMSNPQDYVVFSIDGLADTNHIYRKNVVWDSVMNNTTSFINAGGNAHWDMLVFEHNEHQVDLVEQLAIDMKFSWFRAKVSKRHTTIPVSWLKPPKNSIDPVVSYGDIDCHALKENSIFVDAQGNFFPCCWLGTSEYKLSDFDAIKANWGTNKQNSICTRTCAKNVLGTSFTNQWQIMNKL